MKKRTIAIVGITMAALIIVSVSAFAAQNQDINYFIGRLFREKSAEAVSEDAIAAEYRGERLSWSVVTYYQEIWSKQLPDNQSLSERETIDQIMESVILRKEAEDRGITASEEEVEEKVAIHRQWYEENDRIRASIDAFCEGAEISVEDYFVILSDQSHHSIIKAKLALEIQEELCRQQGLEAETDSIQEEIQEAVQKEIDQIIKQGMKDVIYY